MYKIIYDSKIKLCAKMRNTLNFIVPDSFID